MKRTENYVLFRVGDASAIINAKFLRKKETEDYVFLSVPAKYDIAIRWREYKDGKWQTIKTSNVNAEELAPVMRNFTKEVLENKIDELPF